MHKGLQAKEKENTDDHAKSILDNDLQANNLKCK